MNVQELIDALEAVDDKTLEIVTEGCDCFGDCVAVTIKQNRNTLTDEPSGPPYVFLARESEWGNP